MTLPSLPLRVHAVTETEDFLSEVKRRSHGAALWGMDRAPEDCEISDPRVAVLACQATVEVAEFVGEQVLDQVGPAEAPACGAGCFYCCYAPVTTTRPEAQTLAEHLLETLPEPELLSLLGQLRDHARAIVGLGVTERFAKNLPCPLLDSRSGRCSVYEARPIRCRGANSLSARQCESGCRGQSVNVDVNALLFDTYVAASDGLAQAFAERGVTLELRSLSTWLAQSIEERLEVEASLDVD